MPKFSANLGFLWADRPLPDRVDAAAAAGFGAVEFHFPYDIDAGVLRATIDEVGVTVVSLNTGLGTNGQTDFGVAARPGREAEARELIDQALEYAAQIGCLNVNVVPGATHRAEECEDTYRSNLAYAAERAEPLGVGLLIEPLSAGAVLGAHVSIVDQAVETIEAVGSPAVRVMFDCFHVQRMQGNVTERFLAHQSVIGHVQIAAVPDRSEPDHGELSYPWMFDVFDDAGYGGWVGAEYHPRTTVEAGIGWLADAQS